jgi:hypothetical protein
MPFASSTTPEDSGSGSVVVAIANKLARIAWAVLSSGRDYRHQPLQQRAAATTTDVRDSSTKVCWGEKETKEQSNGVSENLVAKMRPEWPRDL